MGRVNKFTTGVFTDIVGNQKVRPQYDRFIKFKNTLNSKSSEKLNDLIKKYNAKITANKPVFRELANMEDAIMQIRSRENLNPKDIKLNVVREYIYARVPFHRKDTEAKNVRVIVGQVDDWNPWAENDLLGDIKNLKRKHTYINELLKNNEFITIAKEKLIAAMDKMIDDSVSLLKIK